MKCVTLCLAAAALAVATPAFATSTIGCSSTISPTDGPRLWLTVGTAGISQARLEQGNRSFVTGQGANAPVIAQSWLDRNSLRLAIVNADAETEIARLETWRRAGTTYFGTLRYDGRTWRVRCSEAG
jgi:hypothetical protein